MLNQLIFPEFLSENFIIRLVIASLLGAIIGFERDLHGRAAGLRTNLLISLGAALFMLISNALAHSYTVATGDSIFRADPGRIAAQVVSGIGFLGAGAIIKYGFNIRGLTTAACIWLSAGIGMACGAGFFELAIVAMLIGLFCLTVLNLLERLYAKDSYRTLEVETGSEVDISILSEVIKRKGISILYLDKHVDYDSGRTLARFSLRVHHKGITDKISHVLIKDLKQSGVPVHKVNWLRV